jgi:phospholipase/lecithinase/hemolysin
VLAVVAAEVQEQHKFGWSLSRTKEQTQQVAKYTGNAQNLLGPANSLEKFL